MKSVMKNAWRIAKRAARKFSAKATEFFVESLKIAWKEYKADKNNTSVKEVVTAYVNDFNRVFDRPELEEYGSKATVWTPNENRTRIYFENRKNKAAKIWIEIMHTGNDYKVTYDSRATNNGDVMMSIDMFADHAENIFQY